MTLRCDVGHGGVGHSSVPLRLAIPADAFWTVGAGARPAQRASSRLRRSIALRRSPNDAESHAANVRRWNSSSSRLSSWRRVSPVVPPSRTAPGQRRYRQASRLASKLSASCVDRTPHRHEARAVAPLEYLLLEQLERVRAHFSDLPNPFAATPRSGLGWPLVVGRGGPHDRRRGGQGSRRPVIGIRDSEQAVRNLADIELFTGQDSRASPWRNIVDSISP